MFLCSARTVRAATVPTPVRTRIRRAYIACTQIARAPATPPVSSLRTTRTLALTHRAAHTEHRPTHSPRTTRAHSTTRIRRHLPAVPPAPARLPDEALKLQALVSCQSNSNYIVSLPNVSKGCEGATVPAVAALTLPRPLEQKRSSCRPLFSVQ